jgi:hypothetical protein
MKRITVPGEIRTSTYVYSKFGDSSCAMRTGMIVSWKAVEKYASVYIHICRNVLESP